MANRKKNTIKKEMYFVFATFYQNGKGRSRHKDKEKGLTKDKIYSEKTYRDYRAIGKGFADWIKVNHPDCKHLKQCKQYVNEWLQDMIDRELSPYTIATRKAAIVKLYHADTGDFISTPPRYRDKIVRSRLPVERDKHISRDKRKYWGMVTSSTGLRLKELKRVRGCDLEYSQGKYYINVCRGTKGKKPRLSEILDNRVIELFKRAGNNTVFSDVPKALDNHFYRAIYAKRLYKKYARPINSLSHKEKYFMRGDKKGVVLDREAMKIVSAALGHNRISVIASHYLY